jgi:hypothetical protein
MVADAVAVPSVRIEVLAERSCRRGMYSPVVPVDSLKSGHMFGSLMTNAASIHLARASKAAKLLKEATSQEEAALLLDAGLSELQAAVAKAPRAIAERVQTVVNEIAGQMLRTIRPDALADAIREARAQGAV